MLLIELMSANDRKQLSRTKVKVVAEKSFGSFNLALLKTPIEVHGTKYQLGFSKEGTDFTNHASQFKNVATTDSASEGLKLRRAIIDQVTQWLKQHGPILIASAAGEKTQKYTRILKAAGIPTKELERTVLGVPATLLLPS